MASKDVILFVFVAYNGDISPNDVMSPDNIDDVFRSHCIISDCRPHQGGCRTVQGAT